MFAVPHSITNVACDIAFAAGGGVGTSASVL